MFSRLYHQIKIVSSTAYIPVLYVKTEPHSGALFLIQISDGSYFSADYFSRYHEQDTGEYAYIAHRNEHRLLP
jgi:hypothetical protein